jgi:hypothetical protein
LAEIRRETMDAKADGALNLLKAQIVQAINDATGMLVSPDGTAVPNPSWTPKETPWPAPQRRRGRTPRREVTQLQTRC